MKLTKEEKIQWLKDNCSWTVYEKIKALNLNKQFQVEIFDEINNEDSSDFGTISIVEKPNGIKNNPRFEGDEIETWYDIKHEFEDWYQGWCYLKLSENQYLQWFYSS